ncbi:thiamine-phosphate pyrophosphorylase [Selenomonas sp. WCT3]|nr:thiamine-phosphate pyrophosphorylase [Selenomonas ruminantium]
MPIWPPRACSRCSMTISMFKQKIDQSIIDKSGFDRSNVDLSKVIAITNRKLCTEDFYARLAWIAAQGPRAIVLREKDLAAVEYEQLARDVRGIGRQYGVPVILHGQAEVAARLRADGLHLPLPKLRQLSAKVRSGWQVLGTSCHSLDEVEEAQRLGCSYLVAGHIYETDCKQGLPGRGLDFLQAACQASALPVYAIGGITPARLAAVLAAGAAGACVMSGLMQGETWLYKK